MLVPWVLLAVLVAWLLGCAPVVERPAPLAEYRYHCFETYWGDAPPFCDRFYIGPVVEWWL